MANVLIKLNTQYNGRGVDDAGRSVRKLKDHVKGLGRVFSKTMSNLANIRAGWRMISGVATSVMDSIGSVFQHAFDEETALTNFRVLTGSIDNAKKHLEELKQFAHKTPLTFDELQRASNLLLAYGTSMEDIMPTLKMLGDISLANAERFQGLSLAFAQAKAQGRLIGQDLLQMVNRGFNPLKIISEKTGRSISELRDIMADGGISFELVEAAFRAATEEGGKFHNALLLNSQTGNGLMSTIRDKWAEVLRRFGKEFLDLVKNKMKYLITTLDELLDSDAIPKFCENAKKNFATFKKSIESVTLPFRGFLELTSDLVAFYKTSGRLFQLPIDMAKGSSFKQASDRFSNDYISDLRGGGFFSNWLADYLENKIAMTEQKNRKEKGKFITPPIHQAEDIPELENVEVTDEDVFRRFNKDFPPKEDREKLKMEEALRKAKEKKEAKERAAKERADKKKKAEEDRKAKKAQRERVRKAKERLRDEKNAIEEEQREIEKLKQDIADKQKALADLNDARLEAQAEAVRGEEALLGGMDDVNDPRFGNLRALGAAQHALVQDKEAKRLAKEEAKAQRKIDALLKRAKGDEWAARNGLTNLRRLSKRDQIALDAVKKQRAAEKARAELEKRKAAREAQIANDARLARLRLDDIAILERDLQARMERVLNALGVGRNG